MDETLTQPSVTTVTSEDEGPTPDSFRLQTPLEFRDDYVDTVNRMVADKTPGLVGLETMQFEVNDFTDPIFSAMQSAHTAGLDTRFHYDRVARRHIRAGEGTQVSEAYVALGHTAMPKGDRSALKAANSKREELIHTLESLGITSRTNRRHGHYPRGSHNHVKIAIAGDTAWFGTMNQRGIDYEMSNFMVKVTDPEWVTVLKEIFNDTEERRIGEDQAWVKDDAEGNPETSLLLDGGRKRYSAIYYKAHEMAESLQPGDEFVMISQWPPVKMMYGPLLEKLQEKTQAGAKGTYLLSPEDKLHFNEWASDKLQTSVEKKMDRDPNMKAINLPRPTHAKAFMIKRASGETEVLFGSHNFSSWTVKNGTRELAMWTKDPAIVAQLERYLADVQNEQPPLLKPMGPMSGDHIVPEPQTNWDTSIVLPATVDDVWAGPTGLTRMGPVAEGGVGYLLPHRYDNVVSKRYRSAPTDAPLARQLAVGDSIPDGHKEDRLFVRELIDNDTEKTIVFEAEWATTAKRPVPVHYSWQITAKQGQKPDETLLTTRTRMEGLKRPRVMKRYGPKLDVLAMRLVGEAILEGVDSAEPTPHQSGKRLGTTAIGLMAGAAAGKELAKRLSSRRGRVAAVGMSGLFGAALGYRAGRSKSLRRDKIKEVR